MILMYHKVHPDSPTKWWVYVDSFYRQMVELQNKKVVYLDDYDPSNPEHVVITFDGVYENVLKYASPILRAFHYPFELFITTDYLGLDNEFDSVEPNARFAGLDELDRLVERGGRLQWHTRSHPDMKEMTDEAAIENELVVPESIKERFDDVHFGWFAYPYGNFNDTVYKKVSERFRGAVSCIQGDDVDRFKLNRVTVVNDTSFARGTVSLIIASYNYGSFLPEAIESALRQKVMPSEILIVDDCSSDDTPVIAAEFARKYPDMIRFHRNTSNLGIVKNFNNAVTMTSGDYICFLGADNRLLSNYIEETLKVLESDVKVGIAYTDFYLFGNRAEVVAADFRKNYQVVQRERGYYVKFPEVDPSEQKEVLAKTNFIHGTSMYRRDAFVKVGGYLDKRDSPEDHELFKRITAAGYIAKKAVHTFLEYRQHSKDQLNEHLKSYKLLLFYKEKATRLEKELSDIKRSRAFKLVRIIRKAIRMKTYINAFKLLRHKGFREMLRKLRGV